MKKFLTITPLFQRVMVFLTLFIVISGIAGPRIISGDILFRDGFALYGSIGKAMIFGAIAFILLARHDRKEISLTPWKTSQFGWLIGALFSFVVSWSAVSRLLADERTAAILTAAHAGLLLSVVFALLGCFGVRNILTLWRSYKVALIKSALIATVFYVFLLGVYALWEPLASIVMYAVNGILQLTGLETAILPPHTLLLDKFGITVAEYCSGIESIALFTGLYVIFGLLDWKKINRKRYLLLFPVALILLCVFNILRVASLILAGYHINPEIAFSLFHTYAGMVFFILYSALFWSLAYKYIMNNNKTSPKPPEKSPPGHVAISHVYSSDNKGDAALTSVLISDIHRVFPTAEIVILKLGSVKPGDTFEGAAEFPSFMYHALNKYEHPVAKLLYTLYMMPATIVWAVVFRLTKHKAYLPKELRETADIYTSSDLIVAVGGGYIRSRKGVLQAWNIPLILHPLLFGHILGKPTVLYAQSVGPFMHALEPVLVAYVLRKMDLILLREDISKKLLHELGVHKNVTRAIDSGFLLESSGRTDIRKTYRIPAKKLIVGVTVRAWLSGEQQINYEKSVAEALDAIVEKHNAFVLFIPQVTAENGDDDRIVSRRVHQYMHHQSTAYTIEDEPDHHQIKAIYDQLDVLLGTRFHSVIFSLTSYVPVVAIEYEHKTSGIMRDLGLNDWTIKIENVTPVRLSTMLSRLIAEKKAYKKTLKKCVPPYVEKARTTADMMAESYYKSTR